MFGHGYDCLLGSCLGARGSFFCGSVWAELIVCRCWVWKAVRLFVMVVFGQG